VKYLAAFFTLIILYCQGVLSQCFDTNYTFEEGETLIYDAYFNWDIIWLKTGFIEFNVNQSSYNGRYIYHLEATAHTNSSYDWIISVRDSYQCYLDIETLKPLWYHRQKNEGKYYADDRYLYSHENNCVYIFTENTNQPFRKDTLNMGECTWDVLSALYYARNLDLSELQPHDSVPLAAIINNKIYNLHIRFLARDTIRMKNGNKYSCLLFSAPLIESDVSKAGNDIRFWITDDNNRIPVFIEVKLPVGSIKAYLTEMYGLRNKITSMVK